MIGFHVPYRPGLTTFAGLRLALLARELSCRGEIGGCSVLVDGPCVPGVHEDWDRCVLSSKRLSVASWLTCLRKVVWVGYPRTKYLTQATQSHVDSIIFVTSDQPYNEQRNALRAADVVACPSWCLAKTIKDRFDPPELHYTPWDPALPVLRHNGEASSMRLTYMLPRRSSHFSIDQCLRSVGRLLERTSNLSVTLLSTKSLPRKASTACHELAACSVRCRFIEGLTSWSELIYAIGSGDLLAYPDSVYGTAVGLYPLVALTMGVPVIAFDTPITREYLYPNTNAILVPTYPPIAREGSLPVADMADFERTLLKTISQPSSWRKLRRNAGYGLEDRKKLVVASWKEIWK